MQTKLQQRVVGAGVLILFLLPTLIMVIYHVLSAPPRSKAQPIAVSQPLTNTANVTDASNVHTVQLQLPSSQTAGSQVTTSASQPQVADNSAAVSASNTPAVSTVKPVNTPNTSAAVATTQTSSANTPSAAASNATPTPAVPVDTPAQAKPITSTVVAKQKIDTTNTQTTAAANLGSQPVTAKQKTAQQSTADQRKSQVTTQVIQQVAAPSSLASKASMTRAKKSLQIVKTASKSNLNRKPKKRSSQQVVASVSQARHQLLKASLAGVAIKQAWVVQVASFSQKSNAKMLLSKLRHAGFHAYSRQQASLSGKMVNQVFVGPEVRFDKMQAIQQQLQRQFKLNGLIRQYNI